MTKMSGVRRLSREPTCSAETESPVRSQPHVDPVALVQFDSSRQEADKLHSVPKGPLRCFQSGRILCMRKGPSPVKIHEAGCWALISVMSLLKKVKPGLYQHLQSKQAGGGWPLCLGYQQPLTLR
ncbi:hypothetical protein J6590_053871 [Homalodisca vitripennis]|nr:hypothetical protein J6590_053871 [Homalodisca vitripennis]